MWRGVSKDLIFVAIFMLKCLKTSVENGYYSQFRLSPSRMERKRTAHTDDPLMMYYLSSYSISNQVRRHQDLENSGDSTEFTLLLLRQSRHWSIPLQTKPYLFDSAHLSQSESLPTETAEAKTHGS